MDFYQTLNDQLKDEYEGVITYVNLSKQATDGSSHILKDMAREEYVHSKHLKNILQESGRLQNFTDLERQAEDALKDV